MVDAGSPPTVCVGCGDRVGAYESAWVELDDGSFRPGSELRSGALDGQRARSLWHLACVPPARLMSNQ
jgi:hypothetical protein